MKYKEMRKVWERIWLGTIVNTGAVILGGVLGLLLKKGLSEKLSNTIMKGLALCVLYIGITGVLEGQNTLVVIVSMVLGCIIGELADLDEKLIKFGNLLESKVKSEDGKNNIAEGFVSASLLFCVGAMSIVGSLQSGLGQGHETLYTKSILDFVAAIVFASSMGVGVIFSAVFVLIYQGAITLLAQWVSPFLTDVIISEMTCVGSLLIVALALNMLKVTKIKIMNMVPAIFLPIIIYLIMGMF